MTVNSSIAAAASHFCLVGTVMTIEPYGEGHINDTYLVVTDHKRYILQRINHQLFSNVKGLMNNIDLVTSYIKEHYPNRTTLSLVRTADNESHYFDGSHYFRVYDFIENSICRQKVEQISELYEVGRAFGEYMNMLGDFDAHQLYEVIPFFHHTEHRYHRFLEVLAQNPANRAQQVKDEISFVHQRENLCRIVVDLLDQKKIPLRVTHNDTKLNNVLLDKDTFQRLAVIDLDTIMPGSLCYDFGDAIRFGCNSTSEDDPKVSNVHFRIDLFDAFTKGYLMEIGAQITEVEKDHLGQSAILMTYECGMRFLTDYMDGDHYFKIKHPQHNLDRCRTQFALVEQMEQSLEKMKQIVDKYYHQYCLVDSSK